MTPETKSWLVGCLRAGCIFSSSAAFAVIIKQHPKFYAHAVLAVVMAVAFTFIVGRFRPPTKK